MSVTDEAVHGVSEPLPLLPPGESIAVHVLARFWGVHPTHVSNLIEAGEIQAVDLRGPKSSRSTLRVPRGSLVEFLAKRQVIVPEKKQTRRH